LCGRPPMAVSPVPLALSALSSGESPRSSMPVPCDDRCGDHGRGRHRWMALRCGWSRPRRW
jgi:hypothetical protein